MGILTRLRNAFGRSRKSQTAEAEGAARTATAGETGGAEGLTSEDTGREAAAAPASPPATDPKVPSPSPEPQPTPSAGVPEPRTSDSGEHDLVSAAFDHVTVPRPTRSTEGERGASAERAEAEEPAGAGASEAVAEPAGSGASEAVAEPAGAEGSAGAEKAAAEEPAVVAEPTAVEEPETAEPAAAEKATDAEAVTETPEPAAVAPATTEEPKPTAAEKPAEAEAKAEAEAEAEAETDAKPEPQAETPAEPKPEPKPEAEPKPEPAADAKPKAAPKAEPEATPKPEADSGTKSEKTPEAEAEAEAEADAVTADKASAETKPKAKPRTTKKTTTKATTKAEPEATPKAEADSGTKSEKTPEPAAADGDTAPQGPPAPGDESRTDGAGGKKNPAEGEAEAGPALTLAALKKHAPGLTTAYKAATTTLEKNDLTGTRAKVYLVLDRSASMRPYYKDGSAQALAEQTLALAAHLDPEATVPVVFFSTELDGTGEITLTEHENKIDDLHASLGRMGRTSYHAAVEAVLAHHDKTADPAAPALVVFQTDGAPDAKTPANQALTDAAKSHPAVFFSFVAFGDPENKAFDYLRKLKTPNTSHFLAGETPRELTDKELYEGVLANWRP
ncbi:hypothetical protein ADK65_13585 [Streptomyces sp. NRRL B-1140]|uniref:VWA domain-containing protein n=1 Tax=Streptomyces sp. NRRL B-1140 TaxID=1415549 RepID=UPI0006AE0CDF|nr:VWA domain-containing protein [Streptomyces sp. NRRL B-1140]KOX00671.1 hypothetical protein ADK65_13585 [Streptomyces sp. NRRL B-1140]